jgi:hypothetical protein
MSPITKAEASTALAFASGIPVLSGRDFVRDAADAIAHYLRAVDSAYS